MILLWASLGSAKTGSAYTDLPGTQTIKQKSWLILGLITLKNNIQINKINNNIITIIHNCILYNYI